MAEHTAITWCDSTFNPWIGCTRVSPGCDHCYAAVSSPARAIGVHWGPDQLRHRTSAANWRQPLLWQKHHEAFALAHGRRRRVFCASLGDVFDNAVPREWLYDLFALIDQTPNLDWLLLTKRIGNALNMLVDQVASWETDPWHNVWLGATITSQAEADRDVPKLLRTPAARHFVSLEPLLGPVDLRRIVLHSGPLQPHPDAPAAWRRVKQVNVVMDATKPSKATGARIDWAIVGGESGPQFRPMDPAWPRSLRDQCAAAGVPFFFKQWGGRTPTAGGCLLDGVECKAWPESTHWRN